MPNREPGTSLFVVTTVTRLADLTKLALDNADTIAATHGVDCLMLGPGDLRLSLGLPARKFGERDDPRFLEAINRLIGVKHRHGKPLMTVSFKISADEDSWVQHFNLLLATADFVDVVRGHQTALGTIKNILAGLNETLPPMVDVMEKGKERGDSHEHQIRSELSSRNIAKF
jgi:2-keto-3-deoxy-L-rhamnonate aldolase RhmA